MSPDRSFCSSAFQNYQRWFKSEKQKVSCLKFHKLMMLGCTRWQLRYVSLLLFQSGKMASEESQNQQHPNINFDKMVDLINEELVSAWDIMFWKRTSNPQSGEKYDHRNETYTL